MPQLSFKGQTVIVTGAGGGLGKAYSLLFAAKGANVVVNDFNKDAAQKVVDEITKDGGKAVVNNSSATDGEAVIKTALDAFGNVTILINNAGILRDKGFKNMSDQEWDQIMAVHLKGSYACAKAAWPHFQKQGFGRIVNTASAAGLYGNFGQANYSAAKMALVGFTKALAAEGARYNIRATVIAPMAASAMTETIMPPEMLANLKPEFVAPFVLAITHPDAPDASGKIFEVGAGFIAEIRWERSKGAVFKTDKTFTPSAVQEKWEQITDFETDPEHPQGLPDFDIKAKIAESSKVTENPQASQEVRFDGKTVIVTGAGSGLGRAYALLYARLGANVVVNDVNGKAAQAIVDEITKAGGKAVAAVTSAEDGEGIVKTALDKFGGAHVLVANAGLARPSAFEKLSEKDWDEVLAVHLRSTYKCAKALWPIFLKQKYGRIVTMGSQSGLYGLPGLVNYSTAKAGILGFTKTLAIEGKKYNIFANVVIPSAGAAAGLGRAGHHIEAVKEEYIAPLVGYLSSDANDETTGGIFQIAGGWIAQIQWQRAGGHGFPVNKPLQPEDIIAKWKVLTDFDDGRATNPASTQEAFMQIAENFGNVDENAASGSDPGSPDSPYADPEDSEVVAEAKKEVPEPVEYSYTERDVILYNLGIGATEQELQWTYENHEDFAALPTFGVIPQFQASAGLSFDFLPNFNPAKLLHGEQYLSIKAPIPTSGELVNEARLVEVLDKGKAAAVTAIVVTKDKHTGKVIFENQSTMFIRGSGGFGGKRTGKDRGAASAENPIPKRKPDAVVEEKTLPIQAALYRLSGDSNPLHILPEFAAVGGFDKPILHGLCSMGISGKHVLKSFGEFTDIKVRFAGVVYPGETLVTEMWKEGDKVIFTTKVKERQTTVLAAAAATLANPDTPLKAKL
ncbi:multifunctional beta-oxidation protein [Dichomitus squalens LYAD-421 SS1]|uniref:multifunctional beta-oxidation protein n=1 Tax=Dichomitus squalens (strain LYAD-421) TaxID=732165 RepID=UPI00044109A9|nr:multifunctional beta-oxidation protein [Dichomitus squalens LYAD-421 SS1]EJF64655.1 multifunctional beta-oxidation protein [Dichomitus squalens LYAD-421 SS1]